MAAELSRLRGWISASDVARLRDLLTKANLPQQSPKDMAVEDYMQAMSVDKKVQDGRLRLVLLREVGDAQIVADTPRELLIEALHNCGVG